MEQASAFSQAARRREHFEASVYVYEAKSLKRVAVGSFD
jgi:hypothetical protein